MSDASVPNQATEPDQSIASSQQAQPQAASDVAGSALLDASAAAGETTNPQGEPITYPIATNFSEATATGNIETAPAATTSGSYSAEREQPEVGYLHLQDNSDVANDQIQGTLPNTDPIGLPIDPATNHQE